MPYRKEVFGVEVTGDISGLKSAMNEAVKTFNSTERALKNVEKALKIDPTNVDLITKKQELQNKSISDCEKALKRLQKIKREIEKDENFKNGYTDETERYTELIKKITETKNRLHELRTAANSALNIQQKMTAEIEASQEALDRINKSLQNVEDQLKLDPYNVELLAKKSELLSDKIRVCEYATRNYKKTHDELVNDDNFVKGFSDLTVEYTNCARSIDYFGKEAKEAKDTLKSMDFQKFTDDLKGASGIFLEISDNTRMLSRVFQSLVTTSFKASTSYESNIANIKRVVTDLSENTIAELKKIAIETGTAFGDVSEYATFAGALGLAETEVASFTETMLKLNTATGGAFGGEEGAKSVVVFLNALGLAIDEAENFGSAIAVVGDKYADIGDETLKIATAMSGISTIAKVNQYDLIGLAGVMANLGLSGEAATSGITRAFVQVEKAISGSAKGLDDFAEACDMTSKEFIKAWSEKPLETFMTFVDSLKGDIFADINKSIDTSSEKVKKYADLLGMSAETFKGEWVKDAEKVFDMLADKIADMDEEGTSAIATLTGVKLNSIRTIQTLLRLAGQGQEVANAVQLANDAWNENTALQSKANGIYDTTEKKLQGLFESLKQLGAEVADEVLPFIKKGIDWVNDLIKEVKNLDPNLKRLLIIFSSMTATISPLTKGLGLFTKGILALMNPTNLLTQALMNPIGLVAGITALIGGLSAFYLLSSEDSNPLYDLVKGLNESRQAMADLNTEIANNLIAYDLQLHMNDRNVESIEKLIAKINDERTTEEEAAQAKEELKKKVQELNEALGTGWNYDAVKNLITDENGDVIELTKSYEDLLNAKRKAYYLEQYEEAYNKALATQKDALQAVADAKWEYAKATENYTEEQLAFAKYLNENPLDQKAIQFLAELDKSDQNAINAIRMLMTEQDMALEGAKQTVRESQNIIDNYETLMYAEGSTLEAYLDRINNGWNIDPAKNDLDLMYEELEKINYLLSNPDGISMDTLLQMEDAQKKLYDEIKLTEEAKQKVIEMHGEYASLYEEEMAKEQEKHNQILLNAAQQEATRVANHENEMAREEELKNSRLSNESEVVAKQQESHRLALDALTGEKIIEEEKNTLKEEQHTRALDILTEEGEKYNEIMDAQKQKFIAVNQTDSDSMLNTSTHTFEQIRDMWSQNVDSMTSKYHDDVISTHNSLKAAIESNPIVQTIIVNTVRGSGGFGSGGYSGPYLSGSGGFGDLFMGAVSSIQQSMANFRSGGFRSGGLTLNATFNVNSNNIGREEVRSWASWIVDDINEALGQQI